MMKCNRCGQTIFQDEADRVADCFDDRFENPLCFHCAKELWEDEQQSRTMNNPPQDEGDMSHVRGKISGVGHCCECGAGPFKTPREAEYHLEIHKRNPHD